MRSRVGPQELVLVHAGRKYQLALERGPDGVWLVRLDGDLWASGRRLEQHVWRVVREDREQCGTTLAKAVTALFYNEIRSGRAIAAQ